MTGPQASATDEDTQRTCSQEKGIAAREPVDTTELRKAMQAAASAAAAAAAGASAAHTRFDPSQLVHLPQHAAAVPAHLAGPPPLPQALTAPAANVVAPYFTLKQPTQAVALASMTLNALQPNPAAIASMIPGSFHATWNRPWEVHPMFKGRKLRSGKWTEEEEKYADTLIELFEKGHIDEKNGCTLRAFLARKLHCAPMRISKKYAGKGIGKMVYLSKTTLTGIDGVGSPVDNANMLRLKEAENSFLKVVNPEMGLVSAQNMAVKPANTASAAALYPSQLQGGLAPLFPAPSAGPSTSHPASSHIGAGTYQLWSAHQPGVASFSQVQSAPAPVPVAARPAPPTATGPPNTGGQQSAPLAPGGEIETPKVTSHAENLKKVYQAVIQGSDHQQQVLPSPVPPAQQPSAPAAQQTMQQLYPGTTNNPTSAHSTIGTPTAPAASPVAHPYQLDAVTNISSAHHHFNAPLAAPNATSIRPCATMGAADRSSGIPDLLSGFDKVAAAKEYAANPRSDDRTNRYSPTFTSQSFDDFHRLLGKNLSPVKRNGDDTETSVETTLLANRQQGMPALPIHFPPLASADKNAVMAVPAPAPRAQQGFEQSQPHYVAMSTKPVHMHLPSSNLNSQALSQAYGEALSAATSTMSDTPSSIGPDSYNIFAQQSAFAASQHSAYVGSSNGGVELYQNVPPRAPCATPGNPTATSLALPDMTGFHSTAGNANMVSDPSNSSSHETSEESDEALTETIIDSDGTSSEGSSQKRGHVKKASTQQSKRQRLAQPDGSAMREARE